MRQIGSLMTDGDRSYVLETAQRVIDRMHRWDQPTDTRSWTPLEELAMAVRELLRERKASIARLEAVEAVIFKWRSMDYTRENVATYNAFQAAALDLEIAMRK